MNYVAFLSKQQVRIEKKEENRRNQEKKCKIPDKKLILLIQGEKHGDTEHFQQNADTSFKMVQSGNKRLAAPPNAYCLNGLF